MRGDFSNELGLVGKREICFTTDRAGLTKEKSFPTAGLDYKKLKMNNAAHRHNKDEVIRTGPDG